MVGCACLDRHGVCHVCFWLSTEFLYQQKEFKPGRGVWWGHPDGSGFINRTPRKRKSYSRDELLSKQTYQGGGSFS